LCENWQKYSDAINAVDGQVREDLCRRFGDFLDNKEAQKLASFFNYEPEESIKKVCSKRKDFLCCHKCWIGSKFNKSTPIDELMPDAQSDNAVDVDATINYNNNNMMMMMMMTMMKKTLVTKKMTILMILHHLITTYSKKM